MKIKLTILLVYTIGLVSAQTVKTGVNTTTPTETMTVNGTMRVSQLPTNTATNAIYTINSTTATNGTASETQNQTFTAANTVVVDKNGVLGVVQGLPATNTPNVRTIQYTSETVVIDDNTPLTSIVTLGNVSFRFNARANSDTGQFLQYRLNSYDDVVNSMTRIAGTGGVNYGGYRSSASGRNLWYNLGGAIGISSAYTNQVTISRNDFQVGQLTTINNKETYRVTVSINSGGSKNYETGINALGNGETPSGSISTPRQVTLFVERLTSQ